MTGQGLIDLALGDIGVLAPGEAVSADDSAFCLSRLNVLIASLSAQALPIYSITKEVGILQHAICHYQVGFGTAWNFPRPLKIRSAVSIYQGRYEPVEILAPDKFALVAADRSATSSWVRAAFYNPTYPVGDMHIWPTPFVGVPGMNLLELDSYVELATLATLGTTIVLPAGYERMLVALLAPEIAGAFGKPVTEVMIGLATDAKASVCGLNQAILGHPAGDGAPTAPAQ